MSVKKYVRWHAMVSFADWAILGSARFTGPKGTMFDDVSTAFVGPATMPSSNCGKSILNFSELIMDMLALLNSIIVNAVFALGNPKATLSVVMNGNDISVKAIAGRAAMISVNMNIATAMDTLTG